MLPSADPDYLRGVELLESGEWFAAHEAFEDAWRRAEPGERDFLQGLVHVGRRLVPGRPRQAARL